MTKALLFLMILISKCCLAYAQNFELIGIIDGKIVKIDSLTGHATIFQNLQGTSTPVDLTYHEANELYYSLMNTSNSPSLVSISINGEFEEIGVLTMNGNPIQLAEALAYHIDQEKLYVAVSLDGGVSNNDFYSESLVEVNPLTGECQFITEILTNHSNPDIDVMTFIGNNLYFADGAPPGANFLSIYRLDIQSVGSQSAPVLEYASTYLPIRDFTAIGTNIYFTEERNLHRYRPGSSTIELIGTTHGSSDFNGEVIQGISKLESCSLPVVDLGEDQFICEGQTFLLDAKNPNARFTWQDGSSKSTFLVITSGMYWVTAENSCGLSTDSVKIDYLDAPEVDLGKDQFLCNTSSFVLDIESFLGNYTWIDGSNSPIFEVKKSGTYWVDLENICGTVRDSIVIEFNYSPEIDLGEDLSICDESPIELNVTVPNGIYRWQDGTTNPTLEVRQSGIYWVTVENACGIARDSIEITFPDFVDLKIPNVFTPNGDGVNDYFIVDSRLLNSSLKVFQRAGKKVYETINYQNDWDGSNLSAGVYYYLIKNACGHKYKGWVTILY